MSGDVVAEDILPKVTVVVVVSSTISRLQTRRFGANKIGLVFQRHWFQQIKWNVQARGCHVLVMQASI